LLVEPIERRRRIGRLALAAQTVDEATRLAVVAARLLSPTWGERPLSLVAVDAHTGEAVEFTRESGAGLVEAVAASCAVPGVWPPATIGERRFVDGGARSPDNLDLAAGFARVLLISPRGEDDGPLGPSPQREQAARLQAMGARVLVIAPDAAARQAMGPDRLDPRVRTVSAEAGLAQGLAAVEAARFWSDAPAGAADRLA
ncbi:MAG: patatin-like phospholipase family protein, partial [Dehalococcoidia bacterium]|nr:patatin-like phospholipase family protein [Dehalococcoidia bacterium]